MTEPLFDGYPEPTVRPKITAAERRRRRQQAAIDSGIHPLTKLKLAGNGETCKSCAHRVFRRMGGTYPKCDQTSMSGSEATDCRAWWPACIAYQPLEGDT